MLLFKTSIWKNKKPSFYGGFCTRGGTWTRTPQRAQDFKSGVSTNSTTRAYDWYRAKDGIWTRDPHLGKVMLYPWATFA